MAKKDEIRKKNATKAGAILVFLTLLSALGVVAVVNASLGSALTQTGELSIEATPLLSTEANKDLLNTPVMLQSGGCAPIDSEEFVGLWDNASTTGDGLAFNTTGPDALTVCPSSTRSYLLIMQTDFTGEEILDLGAKAVGFGLRIGNESKENQTIAVRVGIVAPTATGTSIPIICGTCSSMDYLTGTEGLYAFTADFIAFMALFPDYSLAINFASDDDDRFLPDLAEPAAIDLTLYGPEVTTETGLFGGFGSASTSMVDSFGAATVLMTAYYIIAIACLIGAVLIWPSSTMDTVTRKGKGGRK